MTKLPRATLPQVTLYHDNDGIHRNFRCKRVLRKRVLRKVNYQRDDDLDPRYLCTSCTTGEDWVTLELVYANREARRYEERWKSVRTPTQALGYLAALQGAAREPWVDHAGGCRGWRKRVQTQAGQEAWRLLQVGLQESYQDLLNTVSTSQWQTKLKEQVQSESTQTTVGEYLVVHEAPPRPYSHLAGDDGGERAVRGELVYNYLIGAIEEVPQTRPWLRLDGTMVGWLTNNLTGEVHTCPITKDTPDDLLETAAGLFDPTSGVLKYLMNAMEAAKLIHAQG